MIQRIQSVYLLLLITVSIVGLGLIPPLEVGVLLFLNPDFTMGYFMVTAFFGAVSLFLFKNRKVQILVNRFNMLGQSIVFLMFLYVFYSSGFEMSSVAVWVMVPLSSLFFLFLANRAIRKDEDLIRSMDRLR